MSEPASLHEVFQGRRGGFLAALLVAEFAAAMQGIAYSTVLPIVATDLDGLRLFGATLASGSIAAVLMLSFAPLILARFPPPVVLLAATALYVAGAGLAIAAPSIEWVLAGTVVRGVASGLFGGFGTGAIGTLFDERERPRVFGLFALIWLLPSLAGPPLNALVTEWAGWRWAIGWPAGLVVVARMLMGAFVSEIPWRRVTSQHAGMGMGIGIVVAAGLVAGAWGSAAANPLGAAVLVVGLAASAIAIVVFLFRSVPGIGRLLLAFGLLCATYFGVSELLSLIVVEGLDSPVLMASLAVCGGLIAWSLVGLRPRPAARPDPALLGVLAQTVGIAVILVSLMLGGAAGVSAVIAASVLCGAGMGAAYPLLSSEPFARAEQSAGSPSAATVGALIAFAETAATAWSSLLSGGTYSALHAEGWDTRTALQLALGPLALTGIAAIAVAAARRTGKRTPQGGVVS